MVVTTESSAIDEATIRRTVTVLLWASATTLWSLITPPGKTFAARMLIFQPLWGFRMYTCDATWIQDLTLFLSLHVVYSYLTGAWRFLTLHDFWWLDVNNYDFLMYMKIFALLGICGFFAGGIVYRGQQLRSGDVEAASMYEDRIDEQLLPPLLISSRTTHSRLFPKTHSFSYSYLFVGIPVGIHGRVSKALSVDGLQQGWLHIESKDYLSRGHDGLGLGEKLKRYLHSQGVTDREYSFAYLVTAPRFLGYSFNPVSFWYLYDSDTRLKYMILEVNNTFDERRMYLLKADSAKQARRLDDEDAEEHPGKVLFTDTWEKDFHVSPFNSRKGSYSLRAQDPLAAYQENGKVEIDNTIVLRSSKEHAKLVARVSSRGLPKDATALTNLELTRFILAWWWVGLLTFPRIVLEAAKLYFQRHLHVWYRPEVVDSSISRPYTDDERALEGLFSSWLTHSVEHARKPLRLIYQPAHHDGEEIVVYSSGFTYEEDNRHTLTIQVLSPAFYSRFIHYAHTREALDRECLATEEQNRTLSMQGAELLPVLLDALQQHRQPEESVKNTYLMRWRWSLLRRIRCPPPSQSYPTQHCSGEYHVSDIRSFADSELDKYVQTHPVDSGIYLRTAIKLFLAQWIGLGTPGLVAAADWVTRATLLVAAMHYSQNSDAGDVFRPRRLGVYDIVAFIIALILANGVHLWSLLKG